MRGVYFFALDFGIDHVSCFEQCDIVLVTYVGP